MDMIKYSALQGHYICAAAGAMQSVTGVDRYHKEDNCKEEDDKWLLEELYLSIVKGEDVLVTIRGGQMEAANAASQGCAK